MSRRPEDRSSEPLARGASIGRYVVLGLVGRGGMGEVYAAFDPELDRKVAVKLLRAKIENGVSMTEGRQRTLREAQAIARLSHPNVVVVYDVGTFNEQVFIAMEFVDGHTASYWVQAQPRTWQEILKVYLAAGRGLEAAHEKGMVHRDFKPENIMVARNGEVRVMDFGLAREIDGRPARPAKTATSTPVGGFGQIAADGGTIVLHQKRPDAATGPRIAVENADGVVQGMRDTDPSASADLFGARLTKTGAIMGTPAYMAPEQFFKAATDARGDQFSFCVALYEALYGERPYPGNNLQTLVGNIVQGNLRPPPAGSKVPTWIRKVLLRGLRPTAAERYPSMDALLHALKTDPRAKHRRVAVGIVLGLIPVALGIGVRQGLVQRAPLCTGGAEKLAAIWELTPPDGPEAPRQMRIHQAFLRTGKAYAADVYETVRGTLGEYARHWSDVYKETCEATQIRHEQSPEVLDLRMSCMNERLNGLRALTQVFQSATGEVVENAVGASAALPSLDRCGDVATLRAVIKPPEDPATRAKVEDLRQRLADLKAGFDSGRWKNALRDAPGLVGRARAVQYGPLLAEALASTGFMYSTANEGDQAEKALVEAYAVADASRHDEVRAEVATLLVYVLGTRESRFSDAMSWSQVASAVLQRVGGHDLLNAWLLNNIGCAHWGHHDGEKAVRGIAAAAILKQRILGPDSIDLAFSEGNLATVLHGTTRDSEALPHADRAIAILKAKLGDDHPTIAVELGNRGEILNGLRRYSEARQSFERAGVIWERELGRDAVNLAFVLTGIGISYLGEQRPISAIPPLQRALRIRQSGTADPGDRAETGFALARALWDAGSDRRLARRLARDARAEFLKAAVAQSASAVENWLDSHPDS